MFERAKVVQPAAVDGGGLGFPLAKRNSTYRIVRHEKPFRETGCVPLRDLPRFRQQRTSVLYHRSSVLLPWSRSLSCTRARQTVTRGLLMAQLRSCLGAAWWWSIWRESATTCADCALS